MCPTYKEICTFDADLWILAGKERLGGGYMV